MIEINKWLNIFTAALETAFPDRVYFVGLQGSYGRGEATETSDIDMVVILDELTAQDIKAYNSMLDTLPHRELICGFLSGKNEILNWEPSDLFQFYHDTRAIKGSLDELLALIDQSAVDRAIKIGACNICHGCVHNMLYDKSEDILRGLYKSASFVMQAVCYKQTGKYMDNLKGLSETLRGTDKEIIDTFIKLKNDADADFDKMSEILFQWAKKMIVTAE
jgi:hypothetical protein